MKAIGISQARMRLFDLVDRVLETGQVVWIEHRDRDSRVALVSEERLKQLEESAKVHHRRGAKTFKLAGSIELRKGEDVGRILEDIRREASTRFQTKLTELGAERSRR